MLVEDKLGKLHGLSDGASLETYLARGKLVGGGTVHKIVVLYAKGYAKGCPQAA
jgi:hypothetical protein